MTTRSDCSLGTPQRVAVAYTQRVYSPELALHASKVLSDPLFQSEARKTCGVAGAG